MGRVAVKRASSPHYVRGVLWAWAGVLHLIVLGGGAVGEHSVRTHIAQREYDKVRMDNDRNEKNSTTPTHGWGWGQQ